LQLLLADWSLPIDGFCLYYAGHRHAPKTLKAFIQAIRDQ